MPHTSGAACGSGAPTWKPRPSGSGRYVATAAGPDIRWFSRGSAESRSPPTRRRGPAAQGADCLVRAHRDEHVTGVAHRLPRVRAGDLREARAAVEKLFPNTRM